MHLMKLMKLMTRLIGAISAVLIASPAFATTMYTDVNTPAFDYTAIQETSTFGDPEPLFDQPVGIGDNMHFFPPNFTATTSGDGGFDQTGSQLQVDIMATTPDTPLLTLEIFEQGDYLLLGAGTAGTGTFVGISGFVTVLDVINEDDIGLGTSIGFVGTVTPSLTGLPGDFGVGLWSGSAFIDIAAVVPDATKVKLSLDNDLSAFSEAGTSAKVQKKTSNGVVIIPTPEPNTLMLIGGGLFVTLLGTRQRRGGSQS